MFEKMPNAFLIRTKYIQGSLGVLMQGFFSVVLYDSAIISLKARCEKTSVIRVSRRQMPEMRFVFYMYLRPSFLLIRMKAAL